MLDEELVSFVRTTIRTIWSLELLIALRARPGEPRTAEALVRELRASDTSVAQALEAFETAGLIVRAPDGAIVYAPASPALDELCRRLEDAYRERPVAVINTIMSTPDERLRTFADAFRLKPPADREDSS